jgi:CheY-like chemotaxis protein
MNGPSAFRPTLLAVDDEPEELVSLERELEKRYGADYRVACEDSAEAGLKQLRDLKTRGEDVAVVLADQRMPGRKGIEFLSRAHDLYPLAKGVCFLSIRWTGFRLRRRPAPWRSAELTTSSTGRERLQTSASMRC